MKVIKKAIENSSVVFIVVAIAAVLGVYSLSNLPMQLFPDIESPQISIQTSWRAASPKEVESELVEPQEEVLRGIPGLQRLDATADQGRATINLIFSLETDMQKTLVDVTSRMNRLPPLPRDALSPTINLASQGTSSQYLTAFFLQILPSSDANIQSYVSYFENTIRPTTLGS
ncbi:efflux RND transporter permease subunit (plasmid) [Alteromonas marina]|uniref:efflux RND transporter permease subunit n=1 Tax=unclassified Alteromonas TaxID=2614992 RepID=UPI0012E666D2|nr:efflux RND transporter permease subunit [Alteromonas sp. KUL150]GFD86898.1 hypothetical protein KUL150_29570 [Alteromonas sp. KUL150]